MVCEHNHLKASQLQLIKRQHTLTEGAPFDSPPGPGTDRAGTL